MSLSRFIYLYLSQQYANSSYNKQDKLRTVPTRGNLAQFMTVQEAGFRKDFLKLINNPSRENKENHYRDLGLDM